MKKRFTAFLLSLAMILTLVPVLPTQAYNGRQPSVYCSNSPVTSVILPQNEKVRLTTDGAVSNFADYQWQILASPSVWVDIAGADNRNLELSYAMVANLLNGDETEVRCAITSGDQTTHSSAAVVSVDYNAIADFTPALMPALDSLVIRQAEPRGEAVIVPANEEIPSEEIPGEDELPDEEVPSEEETSGEEQPPVEEHPSEEETPGEEKPPAEEHPSEEEKPGEQPPAEEHPSEEEKPGEQPSAEEHPSEEEKPGEQPPVEALLSEEERPEEQPPVEAFLSEEERPQEEQPPVEQPPSVKERTEEDSVSAIEYAVAEKVLTKKTYTKEQPPVKVEFLSKTATASEGFSALPEERQTAEEVSAEKATTGQALPVVEKIPSEEGKPVVESPSVEEEKPSPEENSIEIESTENDASVEEEEPSEEEKPANKPSSEHEEAPKAEESTEETLPAETEEIQTNTDEKQEVENEESVVDSQAEIPKTYAIVIDYVFEDGKQAANSWTATVAAGSSFLQTIISPEILGYAPEQEAVELNYNNISEDQTVTVTYYPAEVEYTVVHYQQNIEDDNYKEVERESKTGFTESPVGSDLEESQEGFYALLYDKETKIAADGSTVVEIYYDRYYYLMSFDLDGGYGVEPVYARYGASVSIGTPQRAGYTFNGWDGTVPSVMPAENTRFKASWTPGDQARVTIVIWGENANDEEYSYIKSSEIFARPGDTITYESTQMVCGKAEHAHEKRCYTCGMESHSHGVNCYVGAGTEAAGWQTVTAPRNPVNGQVYLYDRIITFQLIYINGTWYEYDGSFNNGEIAKPDCGKVESSHTHTSACLSCGKPEHTHTDSCYLTVEMDSKLWTYVRSDEVTVAADGTTVMNVYFDRIKFTLEFLDSSRKIYTINEKWGADISRHWPIHGDNGTIYDRGERWDPQGSNAYEEVLVFIDIMPAENFRLNLDRKDLDTYIMHYMEEVLPGETGTGHNGRSFRQDFEVRANYNYITEAEDFFDLEGFTQWDSNPKFDSRGQIDIWGGGNVYFYYTRNQYNLKFYNYNAEIYDEEKTLFYQEGFDSYYFVPEYPKDLEPNACIFDGWYTSAFFPADGKVDFESDTMPSSDVMLYARWVPKTHEVRCFPSAADMELGSNQIGEVQTITHGKTADEPDEPTNGEYTFVGWFYQDAEGNEKAFDFSMPVNRDLKLYAKWSSNVLMEYTIRYAVRGEGEALIYIAEDTAGSALAGTTKTFEAKAGEALFEDYRSGYFPETNSHSLTIDIEDQTKNEFTFLYVPKEMITYTVRYLEIGTEVELEEEKSETTANAVITETFVPVTGYLPDAYQKRLVLSADEDQNVITFWYAKDSIHAPVQIIHYTQNAEGDNYTLYQSSSDLNGIIGQTYSVGQLSIPGYGYDHATANGEEVEAVNDKVTGEVTKEGLILKLYYNRNLYPYVFEFREQGTERILAEAVAGSARYGAQVTQNPADIPGYTCITGPQEMKIQMEDGVEALRNVRIFYYTEQEAEISYIAVGPEGVTDFGSVDPLSEKIKVFTGETKGSVPVPADGYRFAGWYTDENCEIPVNKDWIEEEKLIPARTRNYGNAENVRLGYESAVYYARFEYALADLYIYKSGADEIDENQAFLFHITGTGDDGSEIDMDVCIQGNGSVTVRDLPVGDYVVKEEIGWSWRYEPSSEVYEITLHPTETNSVSFTNSRTGEWWLNGAAYSGNKFDPMDD